MGKQIVSMGDLKKQKAAFTDQFHLDFTQFVRLIDENNRGGWSRQDLTATAHFLTDAEKIV
jgi:hypothetical protein